MARANAAAINASNGSILPWNPGTDAAVLALAASSDGQTIYLGGDFVSVGGQTRRHVAAVDAANGSPTSWAPDAGGGRVKAIAVAAGKVFIGGYFTNINDVPRSKLGAIDASNGNVLAWDAPVTRSSANPYVAALTLTADGSGLLVGGKFDAVQGVSRRNAAELSIADATLRSWKPRAKPVLAIAVTGSSSDRYLAGAGKGGFVTAFGSDSSVRWTVATDGNVQALAASPDTLYLGGHFAKAANVDRRKLAALNLSDGTPTSWNPGANSPLGVWALGINTTSVAAGGDFTQIAGTNQQGFAQLTGGTP